MKDLLHRAGLGVDVGREDREFKGNWIIGSAQEVVAQKARVANSEKAKKAQALIFPFMNARMVKLTQPAAKTRHNNLITGV